MNLQTRVTMPVAAGGDPYSAANAQRRAAGLPMIRTANMAGALLPMPSSLNPRPSAPPARASKPAQAPARPASRIALPLVWACAGLSSSGTIENRGHSAVYEGWLSAGVADACARINAGGEFRLALDHNETLATTRGNRLEVRYLASDLMIKWRPEPRHEWIVNAIRERGVIGTSIEVCDVRASTSGGLRLIESGSIVGLSLCVNQTASFWRSGAVVGQAEGDIRDTPTAIKWMARCDAVTR
jgi:hypothetical protein